MKKIITLIGAFLSLTLISASNPVFPGWYADPEGTVLENRYWIYPTWSDLYENQTFIDCFSSDDLVNWTRHHAIIDTSRVSWAEKCMWAPAVVENQGRYYLFFSANDVHEGEIGGIGVAVSDRPEGPYEDLLGKPLINEIVNGAQPIDQFVYHDEDGSWYMFYGGWGHCNLVRLSDDFTRLLPWEDGNLYLEVTPEQYVEGPFMMKRDGKYYFMWSEGGWGGPDYSVAYAISDTPKGPFKRIGKILSSDESIATGAGHHSVIRIPGTDEYYIVYHRRPAGDTARDHRHTCIDSLTFDKDGFINPVKITRDGVKPRPLSEITVVTTPPIGSNSNYTSFRTPLVKSPLIKLPVGSIRPGGWLRRMLELQRDGLNGHLGTVSAWLDKKDNQWLTDTGDHGWEEVPYWLRGYSSMAYIMGDKEMIEEARTWFEAVLSNQKEDGFLGPKNYEGESPEIWAQMVMLRALQTYYEYSGDNRVLDAMTKYFKWEMTVPDDLFLKGLWQEKRGGDNILSVLWLYNHTGDPTILPLVDKLHRNTVDWAMEGNLPNYHGVNVAQGFREPATFYMYSGEKKMLDATYRAFHEMRKRYGRVPGGMYGADENAREGYSDPRQGAETCAIVEQMASDEILMGFTGDIFWADHCENVAFNTLPAAFTEDMRALRYITSPNMAISDERLHGPSIDNNLRGMLSMSPFSSRCCQHNHGMGWPYFAEHLMMATSDNGLAATLYAENETTAKVGKDCTKATLSLTTRYPFEEEITISVNPEKEVEFPLYLRIPSWATEAEVEVNGKRPELRDLNGKYVCINRKWSEGDLVRLRFPMPVTTSVWKENGNSVSVNYGPLTLSLKIEEIRSSHDSRDKAFVQDDSHWQEGVDASKWPCYVLKPGSEWNYALKLTDDNLPAHFRVIEKGWPEDDYPFSFDKSPLEFVATGAIVPSWGYDETGMTDVLPQPPFDISTEKEIRLIPMGSARLRISSFPSIK